MRKLVLILAVVAAAVAAEAGQVKILGRDYGLGSDTGFLSVGVASWSDRDGTAVAGYGNANMVMAFDERFNLGFGLACDGDDVRWITTATTHWFRHLELGVWWAPFYGYKGNDDPYGVVAGYVFRF